MKIAVTGGSGYVGGVLCRYLRGCGFEVSSLSRRRVDGGWIPYSLEMDPASLPLEGFDVLIHAAYDFSSRGLDEVCRRNVDPGVRLLHAAEKRGVPRFVLVSSMSAYRGCRSNYGKAKLLLEEKALQSGGVVIRPGLVWGEHPGGVMGSLISLVEKFPLVPTLAGHPAPSQYLVHEEDLGRCMESVCRDQRPHGVISAAHPVPRSIGGILRTIARQRNLRRWYVCVPWQMALIFLRLAEMCHIPVKFRSDSLVGLVFHAPVLEGGTPPESVACRRFE